MITRRKFIGESWKWTGLIFVSGTSLRAAQPFLVNKRKAFQPAAGGGGGAPTFDASASAHDSAGPSSLTWSHTVGGANRLLLVGILAFGDGVATTTFTGITYNAIAMTQVATRDFGSFVRLELWRLINPATGAHNVIATGAAATDAMLGIASSWNGVHQTTPLGTVAQADGDSGTSTVDVTSAAGETVVEFTTMRGDPGTYSPGSGQTQRAFEESGNSFPDMGHSSEAGAASVTMDATITNSIWGVMGVGIKPA